MKRDDLPTPTPEASAQSAPELSPDRALALNYALGILVDPLPGKAARRCADEDAFGRE